MKKTIDIQKDNIENLLNIIKENQELEIVPMVSNEVGGMDYSYYMGRWGKAEIDEVYHRDDRIYFRSSDTEELVDDQADNIMLDEYPKHSWLNDEENEKVTKRAEKYVEGLDWQKVIVVLIEYP